jgi:hypothetical protein
VTNARCPSLPCRRVTHGFRRVGWLAQGAPVTSEAPAASIWVMDRDLATAFEANRPRLQAMAYRMLGSLTEAEDAVQETWIRLSGSDAERIDNLGRWLTTVLPASAPGCRAPAAVAGKCRSRPKARYPKASTRRKRRSSPT